MDVQPQLETPPETDPKPAQLAAYRQQLIANGVESSLAAESAYILAYVDPIRDRTEMEQQTIQLAFNDIHWGGQLDA